MPVKTHEGSCCPCEKCSANKDICCVRGKEFTIPKSMWDSMKEAREGVYLPPIDAVDASAHIRDCHCTACLKTKPRVVIVEWEDVMTEEKWCSESEVDTFAEERWISKSVGFLIKENEHCVVLSSMEAPDAPMNPRSSMLTHIPRSCIKSMSRVDATSNS